jgi:hypothetical protein
MGRALGALLLILLACGSDGEGPTSRPAQPAGQGLEVLRDYYTWGGASQPAHDWDVDAGECERRADENPRVRKGAHELVRVRVFIGCMEEIGWVPKDR